MTTKALPAILITFLITGMSIFSVYQSKTIDVKDKTIGEQTQEISFLETSLTSEEEENAVLLADNTLLKETIVLLRDSLALMDTEISRLKGIIKQKDKKIKSINSKLKSIEKQYDAIKAEIAERVRKDQIDQEMIAKLEADKAALRVDMNTIAREKEQEVLSRQETEAELLDRKVSEAKFRRITNLVNYTTVKFNKVVLSKTRYGKAISKIKKENSKWKYTIAEFFLEHDDMKLLLDEQFLVKIVNADNGEVLSYIESNPNFPDSQIDTKGVGFKFDGNMLEVSYFNNQNKKGSNYEIQIFYVNDGEEYLLLNGAQQFIKNRKVVKF